MVVLSATRGAARGGKGNPLKKKKKFFYNHMRMHPQKSDPPFLVGEKAIKRSVCFRSTATAAVSPRGRKSERHRRPPTATDGIVGSVCPFGFIPPQP